MALFDARKANLGPQPTPMFQHPLPPNQGAAASEAVSNYLARFVANEITSPTAYTGRRTPGTTLSTTTEEGSFDLLAMVHEQQDVVADLLEEQLERALDLLIDCRLVGGDPTLEDKRRVLFDLYEAGVVTKAQVRRRGELDPADFHEQLRDHRIRVGRP